MIQTRFKKAARCLLRRAAGILMACSGTFSCRRAQLYWRADRSGPGGAARRGAEPGPGRGLLRGRVHGQPDRLVPGVPVPGGAARRGGLGRGGESGQENHSNGISVWRLWSGTNREQRHFSVDGVGHPAKPPPSRKACSSGVVSRPRARLRCGKRPHFATIVLWMRAHFASSGSPVSRAKAS